MTNICYSHKLTLFWSKKKTHSTCILQGVKVKPESFSHICYRGGGACAKKHSETTIISQTSPHQRFTAGFCDRAIPPVYVMTTSKEIFLSGYSTSMKSGVVSCFFFIVWQIHLPSCRSRKAEYSAGANCWQTSLFAFSFAFPAPPIWENVFLDLHVPRHKAEMYRMFSGQHLFFIIVTPCAFHIDVFFEIVEKEISIEIDTVGSRREIEEYRVCNV